LTMYLAPLSPFFFSGDQSSVAKYRSRAFSPPSPFFFFFPPVPLPPFLFRGPEPRNSSCIWLRPFLFFLTVTKQTDLVLFSLLSLLFLSGEGSRSIYGVSSHRPFFLRLTKKRNSLPLFPFFSSSPPPPVSFWINSLFGEKHLGPPSPFLHLRKKGRVVGTRLLLFPFPLLLGPTHHHYVRVEFSVHTAFFFSSFFHYPGVF